MSQKSIPPNQGNAPPEQRLFAKLASLVGILWLLATAYAVYKQGTYWRLDAFALSVALIIAAWALATWVTAFLLARRNPSPAQKTLFGWLAAQGVGLSILVIFGAANLVASARQKAALEWEASTPGYEALFPAVEGLVRRPGPGGYLRPNLDLEVKGAYPFDTVRAKTNNLGFYGAPDITLEKPENTFRILLLGDSFVAGYRIDVADSWTTRIAAHLQQLADEGALGDGIENVELLPANVETFHPAWWLLEKHGEQLDPDVVIFASCLANDFLQSVQMLGIPPDPPAAEWRWNAIGRPEPTSDQALTEEVQERTAAYFTAEQNPYPEGAFATLDGAKTEALRQRQWGAGSAPNSPWPLGRAMQALSLGAEYKNDYGGFCYAPLPGEPVFAHGDTAAFLKELPKPYDVAYNVAGRSIDGMLTWARGREIPFGLILIPQRFQVVEQDFAATFEKSDLDPSAFLLTKPNLFLSEIAKDHGCPVLDLSVAFPIQDSETYKFFLPAGDIHWNAAGHERASRASEDFFTALVNKALAR